MDSASTSISESKSDSYPKAVKDFFSEYPNEKKFYESLNKFAPEEFNSEWLAHQIRCGTFEEVIELLKLVNELHSLEEFKKLNNSEPEVYDGVWLQSTAIDFLEKRDPKIEATQRLTLHYNSYYSQHFQWLKKKFNEYDALWLKEKIDTSYGSSIETVLQQSYELCRSKAFKVLNTADPSIYNIPWLRAQMNEYKYKYLKEVLQKRFNTFYDSFIQFIKIFKAIDREFGNEGAAFGKLHPLIPDMLAASTQDFSSEPLYKLSAEKINNLSTKISDILDDEEKGIKKDKKANSSLRDLGIFKEQQTPDTKESGKEVTPTPQSLQH